MQQRAAAMAEQNPEQLSFEQALSALEALVEKMESGDLSLEESLQSFERGVQLTRSCQQALRAAEQKVEILTSRDVDAAAEPFDGDA
jgi:exodeoxyribonuclease VII small subunit